MINSTTYTTRVLSVVVLPEGEATYSESATTIRIEDESAGEYVVIEQHPDSGSQQIGINPEEWPQIRAAIDLMVQQCREPSK